MKLALSTANFIKIQIYCILLIIWIMCMQFFTILKPVHLYFLRTLMFSHFPEHISLSLPLKWNFINSFWLKCINTEGQHYLFCMNVTILIKTIKALLCCFVFHIFFMFSVEQVMFWHSVCYYLNKISLILGLLGKKVCLFFLCPFFPTDPDPLSSVRTAGWMDTSKHRC